VVLLVILAVPILGRHSGGYPVATLVKVADQLAGGAKNINQLIHDIIIKQECV
jgi:hypothetical protein